MIEKKLNKLLIGANNIRRQNAELGINNFREEAFFDLSRFIKRKLDDPLFKKRNLKIIVEHFDEIFPYIVASNTDIMWDNFDYFVQEPNFREKFIAGLKKYPYKDDDSMDTIFYIVRLRCNFNDFMNSDIFIILADMHIDSLFYSNILNALEEEKQKEFLNILIENKVNIYYNAIEYKGNNKQFIYDNLSYFMQNAQNLYSLMNFVEEDAEALSKVKEYIDNHPEQAINSIFCETDNLLRITDPTLREMIRLLVIEIMENENAKFSDITYSGGGFSRVILIGDKVIKTGNKRATKEIPNNPYIIAPLLRQEVKLEDGSAFIEVTERVDTSNPPSHEELYQLYKNLRDLGLIWTDIKGTNVGRLKKENIIHWKEELAPSEEVLGLQPKRGDKVLNVGDLVILDADFIYDENDPNINYTNQKELNKQFEERYQKEKKGEPIKKLGIDIVDEQNVDIIDEQVSHKKR